MMAGYPSCQNDQWSDQPTPGIDPGTALPSDGNCSDSLKERTASRTNPREERLPTKPMKLPWEGYSDLKPSGYCWLPSASEYIPMVSIESAATIFSFWRCASLA